MLKEITKKHETRKAIDGTAGSGRRQSITREKGYAKQRGRGRKWAADTCLDKARLEGYYMRVR
jgi:hypothetical protein